MATRSNASHVSDADTTVGYVQPDAEARDVPGPTTRARARKQAHTASMPNLSDPNERTLVDLDRKALEVATAARLQQVEAELAKTHTALTEKAKKLERLSNESSPKDARTAKWVASMAQTNKADVVEPTKLAVNETTKVHPDERIPSVSEVASVRSVVSQRDLKRVQQDMQEFVAQQNAKLQQQFQQTVQALTDLMLTCPQPAVQVVPSVAAPVPVFAPVAPPMTIDKVVAPATTDTIAKMAAAIQPTGPMLALGPPKPRYVTKLKPFSDGPNIEQFLHQFRIAAGLNGWPEQHWGAMLATLLEGKALKLLSKDPVAMPPSFQELSTQLIARFGHEGQPSYFAAVLQHRTRCEKESVHELKNAIEDLAERAYPGMSSEHRRQICLEPFIGALTSEDQRRAVRMARPKDIDEAAEFAIVFESVAKTEAKNKGEPPKRVRAVTMDLGEQKGGTIVDGDAVEVHPPKEMFKGQKKGPPRKPDTQNGDTKPAQIKQITTDQLAAAMAALTGQIAQVCLRPEQKPKRSDPKPTGATGTASAVPAASGPTGRGNNSGCFTCGDPNHWRSDCPVWKRKHASWLKHQGNDQGRRPDGQGPGPDEY